MVGLTNDSAYARRGTYRYGLSLTSQFYFCGVPFRLDTRPKCALNCLYCFAKARGGRRTSLNLAADLTRIRQKIRRALNGPQERYDINGELLQRRVPLHFGGLSDPFCDSVAEEISIQLLETLCEYQYPVIISTKNTDVLRRDDILNLLKRNKSVAVQVSFTTLEQDISHAIEPGAPSPKKRLETMKVLAGEGVYTIARLQPLIYPFLSHVVEDLIPELALVKCRHVVVEFLKIPVETHLGGFRDLFNAINWDGYSFYREHKASLIGREWILPATFKWDSLQRVLDAIHRTAMTYGAGDYGLNHLGDTDCCCGIDRIPGFEGWFKANFANALRTSRGEYVSFQAVAEQWSPTKSIRMLMNSNCRLDTGDSVLCYLRTKWNSPGTTNAPDSFLGVSWTGEYDVEGDCVYRKGVA